MVLVRGSLYIPAPGGGGGSGGAGVPVFLGPAPGSGTESVLYQSQILAQGTFPIAFSIISGALPDGITLDSTTGLLTGTPTVGGNYTVEIQAANALGSATQEFSIAIVGVAPRFSVDPSFAWGAINNPVFTPDGITTAAYTTLGAHGLNYPPPYIGTEPITWTISAGALPDGVTLDTATGLLLGFPNNPAQVPSGFVNFSATIRGTNAWGTWAVALEMQIFEEGYPVP